MNINDGPLQQTLRQIIREEVGPIVREEIRPIIREEVRPIIQEEVRPIIQEEVADIKRVQSQQAMQLREINSGLTSMKNTLRSHSREIRHIVEKVEDLDDRFKTAVEIS